MRKRKERAAEPDMSGEEYTYAEDLYDLAPPYAEDGPQYPPARLNREQLRRLVKQAKKKQSIVKQKQGERYARAMRKAEKDLKRWSRMSEERAAFVLGRMLTQEAKRQEQLAQYQEAAAIAAKEGVEDEGQSKWQVRRQRRRDARAARRTRGGKGGLR
jgi:hypothetical protein